MSKREIELFLFDIYIAIVKIEHTASKFNDAQALLYSYTDWDSVIREFEIIGEASKHLLKAELLSKAYQPVVDFRNVIIHEYFGIDRDEVWDVIHQALPPFKQVILKMIGNMAPELKEELATAFIEDNQYLDFVVNALKNL
jgi:uncharacterized protein with HEPN domain